LRPILRLIYTPPVTVPNFKIPLPRNVSWLVTTEVGGYDCVGSAHDPAHDTSNYFSVDFSWKNKDANGNQVYGDPGSGALIPITPAADGWVVATSVTNPIPDNGNYVVVSHDPSQNSANGFSTRYLHMNASPLVTKGMFVTQGTTTMGYMGNTGLSHGSHLHFGMRYADNGGSSTNVRYATVSGWLMKSFQTECLNGTWNRYYLSQ
jgi:murein DD-endopeptidase MepM/ murein hydrolase activator NlpD